MLTACTKKDIVSSSSNVPAKVFNKETLAFHEFTKQLFGDKISDAIILKTSTNIPNEITENLFAEFENKQESIGDFYMQINSNTEEGIIEIASSTYLSGGSGDAYFSNITLANELGFKAYYTMKFKSVGEDQYMITSLEEVIDSSFNESQVEIRGWFSDYADCVQGVISTDSAPGAIITGLGVAGGAGCVACGIAGAVIFGFGALGCLGG